MRPVIYRGEWCAYWREGGKPVRRILYVSNREEAERAILDIGKLSKVGSGKTIAEMMDVYFADKKGRISSYRDAVGAWNLIKGDIGHLRPDHIDRKWCREYIARTGASNATIRKRFAIVRAGCRWVDKNNAAIFELPSAPPARERRLSQAEAMRLIQNAFSPHVRAFIILALTTGARSAAILGLTWKRVDFERGIINLGKSQANKGRAILPLTDDARAVLLELKEAHLTENVIEHGGKPIKSIKKGFANACKAAKLEGVTPHVLRHTAAVWMAEAGIPMSEISQYLGHSTTRVTESVYARYSPDYLKKAAFALDIGLSRVQKNIRANDKVAAE